MNDWEQFLADVPWFLRSGQSAAVGETQLWTRGGVDALPETSTLLGAATLTPVAVEGVTYELLAWGPPRGRRGWLCQPPRDGDGDAVPQVHKDFWKVCGGIIERFGEPSSWWLNQNEVLTLGATHVPLADVLVQYEWMWDRAGLELPIDPNEHYVVAVEANGNLTLAHRHDGRLLLFAPDHAFSGVTPLPGCPPYSLLAIDSIPNLTTWIEVCARRWLESPAAASGAGGDGY